MWLRKRNVSWHRERDIFLTSTSVYQNFHRLWRKSIIAKWKRHKLSFQRKELDTPSLQLTQNSSQNTLNHSIFPLLRTKNNICFILLWEAEIFRLLTHLQTYYKHSVNVSIMHENHAGCVTYLKIATVALCSCFTFCDTCWSKLATELISAVLIHDSKWSRHISVTKYLDPFTQSSSRKQTATFMLKEKWFEVLSTVYIPLWLCKGIFHWSNPKKQQDTLSEQCHSLQFSRAEL